MRLTRLCVVAGLVPFSGAFIPGGIRSCESADLSRASPSRCWSHFLREALRTALPDCWEAD